jgi:hypothetical protein
LVPSRPQQSFSDAAFKECCQWAVQLTAEQLSIHQDYPRAFENRHSEDKKSANALPFKRQEHHMPLIYVRYYDHVYYRNCVLDSVSPVMREVVGWLTQETPAAIYLSHDRRVDSLSDQPGCETGFIILKSDIIEQKTIRN